MVQSLNKTNVLITREASQAKEFADKVSKHRGTPIKAPLIKIDSLLRNEDEIIFRQLNQYEWLFFTSTNGVHHFFKRLTNPNVLINCKFAVVGHRTEDALKTYGFYAHFIPSTYNAKTMAAEFLAIYSDLKRVLFVRGNLSRTVLLDEFTKHNKQFDTVTVYQTNRNTSISDQLTNYIRDEAFDLITFTSPSTIKAYIDLVSDKDLITLSHLKPCFCIGSTTEKVAKEYGFQKVFVPKTFTINHMIDIMINYVN